MAMTTQRSILANEPNPVVTVRAGRDVRVRGWDGDRVQATTDSRWGLKVERKSATEIARVRAKVGERVLLDVRIDPLARTKPSDEPNGIAVELGASGEVLVPRGSRLKVYAGYSADVADVSGPLAVYTGRDVLVRAVALLAQVSAGGAIDVVCERAAGDLLKLEAGGDIRCHVRLLDSALVQVDDLGGHWEGLIG